MPGPRFEPQGPYYSDREAWDAIKDLYRYLSEQPAAPADRLQSDYAFKAGSGSVLVNLKGDHFQPLRPAGMDPQVWTKLSDYFVDRFAGQAITASAIHAWIDRSAATLADLASLIAAEAEKGGDEVVYEGQVLAIAKASLVVGFLAMVFAALQYLAPLSDDALTREDFKTIFGDGIQRLVEEAAGGETEQTIIARPGSKIVIKDGSVTVINEGEPDKKPAAGRGREQKQK